MCLINHKAHEFFSACRIGEIRHVGLFLVDDFRIVFSKIGTLRNLIPQHVKVMALTATCTVETLQIIKERLAMQEPEIIALSPQRPNIFYSLQPPTNLEKLSTDLADELKQDRINFKKTYCSVEIILTVVICMQPLCYIGSIHRSSRISGL